MPEIATDPPASSSNRLYPTPRVQEARLFGPDPFLPRARGARALRQGKLRQSARVRLARHSPSQAAPAGSCGPAAECADAVGSARPQTASVAGPRPTIPAAAARLFRGAVAA